MTDTIAVTDHGRILTFDFDAMNRYHGGGSPAGVAMAFQVLRRAFGAVSPDAPPPRRSVLVRTAFRGPGARDGVELVTRAVTEGRYIVDRTLVRSELGWLREDFVFQVSIGESQATLVLRDGFVTEEFLTLARTENRTAAAEAKLDALKATLAKRVLGVDSAEVYDCT